jgi:hypothetical protein
MMKFEDSFLSAISRLVDVGDARDATPEVEIIGEVAAAAVQLTVAPIALTLDALVEMLDSDALLQTRLLAMKDSADNFARSGVHLLAVNEATPTKGSDNGGALSEAHEPYYIFNKNRGDAKQPFVLDLENDDAWPAAGWQLAARGDVRGPRWRDGGGRPAWGGSDWDEVLVPSTDDSSLQRAIIVVRGERALRRALLRQYVGGRDPRLVLKNMSVSRRIEEATKETASQRQVSADLFVPGSCDKEIWARLHCPGESPVGRAVMWLFTQPWPVQLRLRILPTRPGGDCAFPSPGCA